MPQVPYDYDVQIMLGGDSLHTARVDSMTNREIAIIAGAEQLFAWAGTDEGKAIPRGAIDYWQSHKNHPQLTIADVLQDLESQFGVQFYAKQVDKDVPPIEPAPAKPSRQGANPVSRRLDMDDDVDIVTILKRRLAARTRQVEAIDKEIAENGKLRAVIEQDIVKLEAMLLSVASLEAAEGKNGHSEGRKRTYKARRKTARKDEQTRDSGEGRDGGTGIAGADTLRQLATSGFSARGGTGS